MFLVKLKHVTELQCKRKIASKSATILSKYLTRVSCRESIGGKLYSISVTSRPTLDMC